MNTGSLSKALKQAGRGILAVLLLASMLALAGCASLPEGVQRPVSQVATEVATTRLAGVAAASAASGDS